MLKSGFFNSIGKDRLYNASDMSRYFAGLISRGVLQNYGDAFKVSPMSGPGGLYVTVGTGKAYFSDGKWVENDNSPVIYPLEAAPTNLYRTDRVILREDYRPGYGARTVSIVVRAGTPASSADTAEPPDLQTVPGIEEMSLCQIHLDPGQSSLSSGDIEDERAKPNECGYVYGLITQLSDGDIFDFWQEQWNQWFNSVKQEVADTGITLGTGSTTANSDDQTTVAIPVSETGYIPGVDQLEVYINGFYLAPTTDYTLAEDGDNIELTNAINTGTRVDFVSVHKLNTAS